jgi:hypothetical protein
VYAAAPPGLESNRDNQEVWGRSRLRDQGYWQCNPTTNWILDRSMRSDMFAMSHYVLSAYLREKPSGHLLVSLRCRGSSSCRVKHPRASLYQRELHFDFHYCPSLTGYGFPSGVVIDTFFGVNKS